jgi:shikimate kinase
MGIQTIFVLGPSGVGKSDLSKALAERLEFEFYEIDQRPKDGIDAHGLRDEWDEFYGSANPERLLNLLRGRIDTAGKQGIVLGFPGKLILNGSRLGSLKGKVRVVYLAGREGQCLDAFLARERQTGRGLDALYWAHNNQSIFDFLRTDEAKPHIVLAFDERARRNTEQVLAEIVSGLAR